LALVRVRVPEILSQPLTWCLLLGAGQVKHPAGGRAAGYNDQRPHQSLRQEPPRQPGRAVDIAARI